MLRGLSVDTRCSLLMGRQWCQSSCRLGVKWGLVEEKGDTENSSSIMFSVDMEVAMQRQNMPAVTILSFSSLFLILDHGSFLILVMDSYPGHGSEKFEQAGVIQPPDQDVGQF